MENKKDLDLLLNNDIESKQLYSTYEWILGKVNFICHHMVALVFCEMLLMIIVIVMMLI